MLEKNQNQNTEFNLTKAGQANVRWIANRVTLDTVTRIWSKLKDLQLKTNRPMKYNK